MDDEAKRHPVGAPGEVVVIFVSRRTPRDPEGYAAAAEEMDALAARQPGYRGLHSARDADGIGITVSYWADEAAALAWRAHPDHARVREAGRDGWYDTYEVAVARIERAYRWDAC